MKAQRSLDAWLDYLLTLHPRNIELGLERVASVAERLALLTPAPTVVTVAGTNGKGTTTTLVEALALHAGKRVGVYTSPHLLRYNERIRVNGLPVDDRQIVAAFEVIEAARGAVPLTFFEFGTLAALQVFAAQPLDVVVLEVGLGGRLDATNIVDPDIAVITSIALDHQEWLGDTREAIGAEKAGILRTGVPAIIADRDPPDSVLQRAAELQCPVERWSDRFQSPLQNGLRPENVFAALAVARRLGIHPGDAAAEVLAGVTVPGRLQRTSLQGRPVVLDVAHNPHAAAHLANNLDGMG
ncbi:MAG: Mur ligase family protein, partial [Halieaceae bacterium]|nr:Mur ligase family protein [Halieaceae bacterium]